MIYYSSFIVFAFGGIAAIGTQLVRDWLEELLGTS